MWVFTKQIQYFSKCGLPHNKTPFTLIRKIHRQLNSQYVLLNLQLFIAEEHEEATEFDYQKALALISHVEEPADVRHKIWCSAILRDAWDAYNINAPQETLQNLMFFKLVDLCFFLDGDLEDFLPPIDDLLDAPELGSLTASKSFQFLLRLCYEHIFESYHKKWLEII